MLQGQFDDHVDQFVPGNNIVVIGIELFEQAAAEPQLVRLYQALGEGDELTPGDDTIAIFIEHIKQFSSHFFDIHAPSLAQLYSRSHQGLECNFMRKDEGQSNGTECSTLSLYSDPCIPMAAVTDQHGQ